MNEIPPPSAIATPRLQARGARFSLNSASVRLPLTELAPAASRSGFQGLELWARDIGNELSTAQIFDLMRSNGLHVSAFQLLRDYEGSPEHLMENRLEEAERLMADMAAVGAETLLVCANTSAESSGDPKRIARDLSKLADMADQRGMRIAFEPLAWSLWISDYEAATACIKAVDHQALGLAVDAFHWFWAGTPIEFARTIPMEKCFGIQLSDARPNGLEPIQVARHQRLFPGEGIWPVAGLVREFRDRGFAGYYNIEVFNDTYRDLPVEQFVKRAVDSINLLY